MELSKFQCTIKDLLGTSCSPCKRLEDVEARLLEAETLVASLNAEHKSDKVENGLTEMENLIACLKTERITIKSDMNVSHDRMVGKLPPEIASHMFKFYINMDKDGGIFPSNFMAPGPLLLGAVCHAWRRISWSLPQLWTTMAVDISRLTSHQVIPELATQWLNRTGTLPISIQLYANSDKRFDTRAEEDEIIALIHIINSFSSRWKMLDLELPSEALSIFRQLSSDVPRSTLQYLQVLCTSGGKPAIPHLFKHSNTTYFPTHVSLTATNITGIHIEWNGVTNFEARRITVQESLSVIRSANRLNECTLSLIYASSDPPLTLPPVITNLSLHSLSLHTNIIPSHAITFVIDALKLPSLESLSYQSTSSTEAPATGIASLIALINRSSCELKSLQIVDLQIPRGELLLLLQATPSLQSLSFRFHPKDDASALFKYLSRTNANGSSRLPYLKTLKIRVGAAFSWIALANLYDHRQSNAVQNLEPGQSYPLQRRSLKVHLQLRGEIREDQYIDLDTLDRLFNLIAQGINISIIHLGGQATPQDFMKTSASFHSKG